MFEVATLIFFYFFAGISIWLGFVSLRGGLFFSRYLRSELDHEYPAFTPFTSVFVPCRGIDSGLRENIEAILAQDYPDFEVIFVTDNAADPALAIIEEARNGKNLPTLILVAGEATDSGQKVHNLRAAVAKVDPKTEIFVFVDTDARPQSQWLRNLVAPLSDDRLGATTGYRWFVPERGGLASHLQSVWNASIASALGALAERNFCWGGSTAIRREVFERLNIRERWKGTVSDDFTMTRVLQEARLPIKFIPQCLTPAFDYCHVGALVEFTTRQLKITLTYARNLWRGVLASSMLFVLVFFGGIVLVVTRAALGLSFAVPLLLLVVIFLLGAVKAYIRLRAVSLVITDPRVRTPVAQLAHLTLWPLASVLYLYNSLAASASRRIIWRGITYELKSPTEAVIIRRQSGKHTTS